MRIIKTIIPFFTILLVLIFSSCSNISENTNENDVYIETEIELTKEQFKANNMELDELSIQFFEEKISCNGNIIAPADAVAQISSQVSGIVETINYPIDSYVKKGDVLCIISSHELIVIQQNYIETTTNLARLKLDYERSKSLYEENIGSEKEYISKKSLYESAIAKCESLKLKLELLNIDTQKILDGEQYSSFPIIAPISGYITKINIVLANYIEPQSMIFEIIDTQKLQLQLSIFENNISNIDIGQNISFKLLDESGISHSATIKSIGKTIDSQTKTVKCIAETDTNDDYSFTVGSFVDADISIIQKEAPALPNEAIFKSGSEYYVLVVHHSDNNNYFIRKEPVEIGISSNGYTEIMNANHLSQIIVQGGYNIMPE